MGGFAELLFAVIGGGGAPAPELQVEIPLESGARVVMIGGATEDAGRIGVAVAVPVGWADAGGVEGAITAQLAARFAVTPKDGASSFAPEVLPTVTLYCGTLAADSVEAELAELAERLIARECDLALFDAIDDGIRRPPPASAFDRLREATAPGCAEGGGPFGRRPRVAPDLGATAATEAAKARMLEFLAARVGSEGCVIALVGAAPSGEVALAAARAFECLPRARGVAPPAPREAALQAPRRVAAPAGDARGAVGVRLAWHDDPLGDLAALSAACFADAVGSWPEVVERDRLGGLLASPEAEGGMHGRALAATLRELQEQGLTDVRFERLLGRLAERQAATRGDPQATARQLALDGTLHGRYDASALRVERWRTSGRAAAEAALRQQLRPAALVEVVPAAGADG